ncbi:MAG: glycine zipper 2TM domain-containing protein [Thiobacillus sp.]|nr:glycine zipper 2TM domain-containing protein [Thiobacillus sp.]
MKTRTFNTTLIAALLAATGTAQAAHPQPDNDGDGFTARAQVLSSTPIYDTVNEPRRECWTETVGHESRSYRDGNNTGSTVLGAIAGGLLGSTVGKGNGKVAAAAVGAATGAVVGSRWNNGSSRYESSPRQVERCRTTENYRQVVSGYDVRYRFQGREYNTRLPNDPGKWLTLNVSFNVAEDQRPGRWNNSYYDRND